MKRALWVAGMIGSVLVFGCGENASKPVVVSDAGTERGLADGAALAADLGRPEVTITAIVPDNGPACPIDPAGEVGNCDGFVEVVLTGTHFAAGASIAIDGGAAPGGLITEVNVTSSASLSFRMPRQPYDPSAPYRTEIRVLLGGAQSNVVTYQYTVTDPATSAFHGGLLDPQLSTYRDFSSQPIRGKVYLEGSSAESAGPIDRLIAEVGISARGSDPTRDYSFRWFPARFVGDEGDFDLYEGSVVAWLDAEFRVAYRFSRDNGRHWVYADSDAGDLVYRADDAGTLTVLPPPPLYCQSDADCVAEPFHPVCRRATNWQDHRCVQCLQDGDCVNNPRAIGPRCDASNGCYCETSADCATNGNGLACLPDKYCGCQSPDDCAAPQVCYQDSPAQGMFGCGDPEAP